MDGDSSGHDLLCLQEAINGFILKNVPILGVNQAAWRCRNEKCLVARGLESGPLREFLVSRSPGQRQEGGKTSGRVELGRGVRACGEASLPDSRRPRCGMRRGDSANPVCAGVKKSDVPDTWAADTFTPWWRVTNWLN